MRNRDDRLPREEHLSPRRRAHEARARAVVLGGKEEAADALRGTRRDLARVEQAERGLDAGNYAQVGVRGEARVRREEAVDGEKVGGGVHFREEETVGRDGTGELQCDDGDSGVENWRREDGTNDGFEVVKTQLPRVNADKLARSQVCRCIL